jgi:hypothetical protein
MVFFDKLGEEAHVADAQTIGGLEQDGPRLSPAQEKFPDVVVDIIKGSETSICRQGQAEGVASV